MSSQPGTRTEKPLTVTMLTWLHAWKETGSHPRSPLPGAQGFEHWWGSQQLTGAVGATVGELRNLEGWDEGLTTISHSGPSECGCDVDPISANRRGRSNKEWLEFELISEASKLLSMSG